MTKVYEQFEKSFSLTKAYVIVNSQGELQGSFNLKYSSSGMSLIGYLHLYGLEMKRVTVKGCGYDRVSVALNKLAEAYSKEDLKGDDKLFIDALLEINHDFQSFQVYGNGYKFFRAI
jgi:hypothetical protein